MPGNDHANMYGPNTNKVYEFLSEILDYSWLANVGKPHPCDSEVIRVWTLEDAWSALPEGNKRDCKAVRKIRSLFDHYKEEGVMIREQWDNGVMLPRKMIWSLPLKIDDDVHGKLSSWTSWTVLELMVSFDETTPYFFRRKIPWYRDGHWPVCIRDIDDKIVVF